jgi:hypothetical protein
VRRNSVAIVPIAVDHATRENLPLFGQRFYKSAADDVASEAFSAHARIALPRPRLPEPLSYRLTYSVLTLSSHRHNVLSRDGRKNKVDTDCVLLLFSLFFRVRVRFESASINRSISAPLNSTARPANSLACNQQLLACP